MTVRDSVLLPRIACGLIFLLLVVTACGQAVISTEDDMPTTLSVSPTITRTIRSTESVRLTPTQLPALERVPTTEPTPRVIGEVPDELMERVLDDLVARTGTERAAVVVLRAQEMRWDDGTFGCAQPGAIVQPAPVDGYWIVLQVKDEAFDYRARRNGFFRFCANPPLPGSGSAPVQ